jgi:superfamily II DNA/RNA helicase
LKAIAERGYSEPTPIQAQAIPQVLMMRDVMGLAQTGTGKTASFVLPMIEVLHDGRARARMPRSLILEPTRELAAQVAENFDVYGKYHKLNKALLVGGESMQDQQRILERGVDVLIATPGRLLDLFERGNILLNDIKILIIDEADRMLDMGFIPDIEKIVSRIPAARQTLMFSATMPPEIKRLSEKFLQNPKMITVAAAATTAVTVSQNLVWVPPKRKREALDRLIKMEQEKGEFKNTFVFCNRKRDIDDLAKWLRQKGYKAAGLHGDMVQAARYEVLGKFKADELNVMVCSDVAARGLDISGVSHVFNYDIPMHSDDYVHRIGRTGRAGREGRAYSLATPDDEKYVASIQKLIKKDIPVFVVEGLESSSGGGDEERSDRGGRDRDRDRNRGGDRPRSEDAPQEQRAERSESPREERPREERPRNDRPRNDRPREDRPREDRSRDEQPRREGGRRDEQNREIQQVRSSIPREERHPRRYREEPDDGVNSFTKDDLPGFLRR